MGFLGKITQGVSKGVNTAGVKAKEALDLNRAKGQISALQQRRRTALEELGSLVYTTLLKGTFDQEYVHAKALEISALEMQVQEKERDMELIRLQAAEALGKAAPGRTCACGTPVTIGVKFCQQCGARFE